MDRTQIQQFCRRFFQATGCPVLRDEPGFLQVELPREIDKELMDRPYYWMWVEATGQDVPPTVLNLVFDPATEVADVEKTELVALGSYRLEKMFQSAARRGQFVRQCQTGVPPRRLVPFLLTSLKISYLADRRRDELRSYGVNLETFQMLPDLYETACKLPLSPELPPGRRTDAEHNGQLLASLRTGWQQIKQAVLAEIRGADHSWAEQAKQQLEREIEQLETYYQSLLLENGQQQKLYAAERELRIAELRWRCQPRIRVEPLHFALLYLDPSRLAAISANT